MTHEYVFKAEWRSTATLIKIEADTVEEAQKKAERAVRKMEGWPSCLQVKLLHQTR